MLSRRGRRAAADEGAWPQPKGVLTEPSLAAGARNACGAGDSATSPEPPVRPSLGNFGWCCVFANGPGTAVALQRRGKPSDRR
jgi:hypothetical protein